MRTGTMIRICRRTGLALLALIATPARAADPGAVLDTAMAGTRVPAMGVAVLRDGHIDALAVRGVRALGSSAPVRTDDLWHIGSDAKAITATMIARLVERGVLHWDDTVGALLPDLAAAMQPQYARATLDDLLSHRAGLPHDLSDDNARALAFGDSSPPPLARLHYIARALGEAPAAPPGAFGYSNTGYLVAAAMAERATGESYETLLQREVLAPLGMDHARFGTTRADENRGHRGGQVADPDATNPVWFAPAGALVLPLADWATFCLDQLAGAHGRGRLLTTAGYVRLQRPRGSAGYAMGWVVQPGYAGHGGPVLVHGGSDTNWYAIAVLFPKTDRGVLVVANAGADMGGEAADRAVLAAIVPGM